MALFQKGKPGGPGRPKGSGLVAICREFAETEGFARLIAVAKGEGRLIKRIRGTNRIIEVGPSQELQFEALKLVLAYGVGKPREQMDLEVKSPPRIIFELANPESKGH